MLFFREAHLGLFLTFTYVALCFNPIWKYVGGTGELTILGLTITDGVSLAGTPHEGITAMSVNSIYPLYFYLLYPTTSMINARKQIMAGSAVVDDHEDRLHEDDKPNCHFDDESFQGSQDRLVDHRKQIAVELSVGNATGARDLLGRALHTLQDFYSHTNWVELGYPLPSQFLGRPGPVYPKTPVGVRTCNDCTYADGVDRNQNTRDTTACRARIPGTDPLSEAAKTFEIKCMFLQPGRTHLPTCDKNLDPTFQAVPPMLTSGYFGTTDVGLGKPALKCSHGGPFDRAADGIEGISKDTSSSFLSPRPQGHPEAVRLAKLATVQYLNDIRDDLCPAEVKASPFMPCPELRLLYGVGPTLTFVIDTTGSMGPIIDAVKAQAIKIVKSKNGTEDEPAFYILATFNDPVVPDSQAFVDPDAFIAAILKLDASGGGDCQELAMHGLLNAVERTGEGGYVFLWTDAGAKDLELTKEIGDIAAKKRITVFPSISPSSCSSANGFDEITKRTGGQYFNVPISETGPITTLVEKLVRANTVRILYYQAKYQFNSIFQRQNTPGQLSYDVPVDSSMSSLTFSFSALSGNLTVSRPDGSNIRAGDPGVEIVTLSAGSLVSIETPSIGVWTAATSGTGNFTIAAYGTSKMHFSQYSFVEERGRPGHEGFFEILDTPSPGATYMSLAILDGNFSTATFEFRGLDGTVISPLNLTRAEGGDEYHTPDNYFFGNVTIPTSPFYVYAFGEDSAGTKYLRILPGLFDIVPTVNTTANSTTNSTTSLSRPPVSATTALPSTGTGMKYPNSTASGLANTTSTICHNCPVTMPCSGCTTVVQTIVYLTSCPLTSLSSTLFYGTSTVTTTLAYPCYSNCGASPVVTPPPPGLNGSSAITTAETQYRNGSFSASGNSSVVPTARVNVSTSSGSYSALQ